MVRLIDYKEIEKRWQKAWADAKLFEPEPNHRKGIMVFAAEPYLDMPQHVGHLRTYGTADAYARYMRMKGFNVLYPMCWHATGTPVLAIAKRVQNNEKELIDRLRSFKVSDSDIEKMKDPAYIADYFMREMSTSMRAAGYGIDWRRTFVSTEPIFSKMVEWQFMKLKEKGYLKTGRHPVGWCTKDNSPVGQHDTKHDVHPQIEPLTGIKFKDASSGIYFVCATYRPETVYGVTNIFVNDNISYVVAKVGNEQFYLAKEAAQMLSHQFKIDIEKEIPGKELLGKKAINPVTKEEVPVFPGYFVKGDRGTGVVMSVPAHAPFDYVALERLKGQGYQVPAYKKVIELPQKFDMPAQVHVAMLGVDWAASDEIIEQATKNLYSAEAKHGVMLEGRYKGDKASATKEKLKGDFLREGIGIVVYELANEEPVYCRDGTRVIVKIVDDQWFITYGDEAWKAETRKALAGMKIYPEKLRHTYENVIDWLDMRAAERSQGLGTRFPFNPSHIIESLSDSTIYMSFFTYSHILKSRGIKPEQLKPEFFDYVVESKGTLEATAKATGIDHKTIKDCKESFEYWYQNTSSHSGPDLITNHLTMYVFNHTAIMPEKYWPKQIVTNGFINYEGEKMSKSLGSVVPLADGIGKFGADPLRMAEMTAADLDSGTEFSLEAVNGVISRNEYLYNAIEQIESMKGTEIEPIDYWLYSKLHSKIEMATKYMDEINFRNAYTEIFYNSVTELKRYFERGGKNQIVVRDFLEKAAMMLSPIMPHVAEEFWAKLRQNGLIAKEQWPSYDKGMIDQKAEFVEKIIDDTIRDAGQAIALTSKMDVNKNKKPKEIRIIIPDAWKMKAYNSLAKNKNMAKAISDPLLKETDKAQLSKFLSQFAKDIQGLVKMPEVTESQLYEGFVGARNYISGKLGANVVIELESGSKSARASRALPDKPSIDVSWA